MQRRLQVWLPNETTKRQINWQTGNLKYRPPEKLSACLFICMSVSACLPPCMSVALHACLSACLSLCMYVSLHVCLSAYLSLCMSVSLHVCLSACLFLCFISLSLRARRPSVFVVYVLADINIEHFTNDKIERNQKYKESHMTFEFWILLTFESCL